MADDQNPQTTSNHVGNTSSASGSAVTSAPLDGVQKTAKDWGEYEAAHIARTGPPGQYFKQFIERLEAKALKEQEVKLLGTVVANLYLHELLGTRVQRRYRQ